VEATSTMAGAAVDKAASNKKMKYSSLQQTHLFVPVSVETKGSWNVDSINFVSTIGKKLTEVSGDPLETIYLFQRISVAIQRGNYYHYYYYTNIYNAQIYSEPHLRAAAIKG